MAKFVACAMRGLFSTYRLICHNLLYFCQKIVKSKSAFGTLIRSVFFVVNLASSEIRFQAAPDFGQVQKRLPMSSSVKSWVRIGKREKVLEDLTLSKPFGLLDEG